MLGLSIITAVGCVAVVFFGSAVQASVGIGMGMLSAPVLALADPDFVPAAIVLSVIPLSGAMAWSERHHIDRRHLALTLGGRVPGTLIGAALAAALADDVLGVIIALTVIAAVAVSIVGRRFRPTETAMAAAGMASGITSTATGVGGPPIALAYQHHDPEVMRATLSSFFAVGAVMSTIALIGVGELGAREVELSLLVLPGVLAGVAVAGPLRRRLTAAQIRPAVLVLCSVAAGALLLRSVT